MAETDSAQTSSSQYHDPKPFTCEAQGHSLRFYAGGPDRLESLLKLIDGARESIRIAFYIFSPDRSGQKVRAALTRAAQRGVSVTVIVDGYGASVDEAFFSELIAAGGIYHCFLPKWTRRYLIRNHQKIVVVDDDIAMLGGFNIEDGYFAKPGGQCWTDLGFTVQGPAVERIAQWFDELESWLANPKAQFLAIRRLVREWEDGDGPVQLLIGGPTKGLSSWARSVRRDLMAGERLDMVMAYFSPPPALRKRIERIARKGKATLVLSGKTDNGALLGASRALYSKLLKRGTRIYEFDRCKLHTKLIVIDDVVYLGSANFDMRSLYINLEIDLRIEDKALADRMRELVAHHAHASLPITPELHAGRAILFRRLRWWISWFLVSVADYTVSRKLNLGQ